MADKQPYIPPIQPHENRLYHPHENDYKLSLFHMEISILREDRSLVWSQNQRAIQKNNDLYAIKSWLIGVIGFISLKKFQDSGDLQFDDLIVFDLDLNFSQGIFGLAVFKKQ